MINKVQRVTLVFLAILICIALFFILFLNLEYNELKAQKEELELSLAQIEYDIEDMEYRMSCEFNEDYVSQIAREKLNLRYPDEVIFYNDLTE